MHQIPVNPCQSLPRALAFLVSHLLFLSLTCFSHSFLVFCLSPTLSLSFSLTHAQTQLAIASADERVRIESYKV